MRSALGFLKTVAPVLGAGIASFPWWLVVVVAAMTVFLYGAEPAMRWLDVSDRVRSSPQQPPGEHT
jgi:hypothetical protein